jgi:tetratricopeptide (TPR) repeat protein
MGNGGVRLQKLRDFTVQIRHPRTDAIVGTGIAVSSDGKIVTCAHVVIAAGVNPREGRPIPGHWQKIFESIFGEKPDALKDTKEAELIVYFPRAGGDEKRRRAKVMACFPEYDDDIVLLQLVDGLAPLAPEQIPVLGTAEDSEGHPFRSYGYRPLGGHEVGWAYGKILGCVECPEELSLRAEPLHLQSQHIAPGMSGAPVLDVERNLVVGIISETWFPDKSLKDRDTAWAVDVRVLTFPPFQFSIQNEPFPMRAAPQPKTDMDRARAQVAPKLSIAWNNAPAPIPEWVGRAELLKEISVDWASPNNQITGLIGFGGEGKSSLARWWLEDLLADKSQPQPEGIFWWGFCTKPSVDEFFEAALKFMSGGKIDLYKIPSANVQAQVIGAMLGAGRYLFVLDGLEVIQHQEGDQYGLLKSENLREFLEYFAAPDHQSFCLITSRAPVLDLMDYDTYTHRDVTRLNATDGRDLLRKLGVKGDDRDLDKVVADWDGHALTLSLLAGYLIDLHGGNVAKIDGIPPPTANEDRYERVHRVLRQYDYHLTDAERALLMLLSVFRTPVDKIAFKRVFRSNPGIKDQFRRRSVPSATRAKLDDMAFEALLRHLLTYRVLRYDPRTRQYTVHTLVRNYYLVYLRTQEVQARNIHERIKRFYLKRARGTPYHPTLEDMTPSIEAVHHACCAGAYDEAWQLYWQLIAQGERYVIINQLGANETALALMLEFFPDGDTSQDPKVSDPIVKRDILNDIGWFMMHIGQLEGAQSFFERAILISRGIEDWESVSLSLLNLAQLHAFLGKLEVSAEFTYEALELADFAKNKRTMGASRAYRAWVAHLRGDLEKAETYFKWAQLEDESILACRNLCRYFPIEHADHLRRISDKTSAWYIEQGHWSSFEVRYPQDRSISQESRLLRVFGDQNTFFGEHRAARVQYDEAIRIARRISFYDVLIEALLARGRWSARHLKDAPAAFNDLNEALEYAVQGGYRIYEVDIRIALAWAHLSAKDKQAARAEVQRAKRMSEEMGYFWGKVDAEEVLAVLDKEG